MSTSSIRPTTAPEETLGALSDLLHQGKVRAIGSSNVPAERIAEAQWTSDRPRLERFVCEQAPYSLFRRGVERSILPTCARYGLAAVTWAPLDGSWLSGRLRGAHDLSESHRIQHVVARHRAVDPNSAVAQKTFALLGELERVAGEVGLSIAHLALAFALEHRDVTAVIIGPRTLEQLRDSLAAANGRLDTAVLDAVDGLVPPGTDVTG